MEKIYNLLLSTIGLSFKNGRLFDEDKGALLLFKNKYIAESESNIMRGDSMVFDLLGNRALTQYLFQVYVEKETEDGNIYLVNYGIVPEIVTKDRTIPIRRKLLMVIGDGDHVETHFYYNESLAYIEAIFLASGMMSLLIPDLSEFDSSEVISKK